MSHAKDYWDSAAGVKEFTIPFDASLFSRFIPSSGSSILDIGCGYGRTLKELHDKSYRNLSGADISQKMLDLARENVPGITCGLIENETLPFEDNSFDAVIILAVLTCIASDEEQKKLISEAGRVLKTDGIIYLCDFLLNSDGRNIARYEKYRQEFGSYGVFRTDCGGVLRHHTEEHIAGLCSGFEILHFEKNIFRTMNGHTSNGFSSICRKP